MKLAIKRPSAWLPIVMSIAALAVIAWHIARFGTAAQRDERTAAHLWQLLMAGQVPVIVYFSVKWLPQTPNHALCVLGLQVAAGIAACFPVFWFRW